MGKQPQVSTQIHNEQPEAIATHVMFDSLTSELQLLLTIFGCEPINLEEVVKVLNSLSREKRMLVGNCVTVKRIIDFRHYFCNS